MQISEISRYSANFDCIFVQKIFIFEQWLRLFFSKINFLQFLCLLTNLQPRKKLFFYPFFCNFTDINVELKK